MSGSEVLNSNRARLKSIIALVDSLTSADFPHEHSRDALNRLRSIFETGLARLDSLSPTTDERAVRALCAAELRKVFELLPLVGFTHRSTEVRNAFEVHRPFLRIVQAILGPQSGLVISSEWGYSPFTFLPPTSYGLADIVMIGIPAPESQNALILPLAGHELGHNVWAKRELERRYGPIVENALVSHILQSKWREFSECFADVTKENITDIVGQQSWKIAWSWAMRQCEELFCDFLGMALFAESFLHAYSYLLAPGLPEDRDEEYPGSKQRAAHQAKVASRWDIALPPQFVDRFENEDAPIDKTHRLLLALADDVTAEMVDGLAREAHNIVQTASDGRTPPGELERIADCYGKGVPAQQIAGIAAAVNAAWSFFLSGMSPWRTRYPGVFEKPERPLTMLSDLVFKTIEVHEIELRTNTHATRG